MADESSPPPADLMESNVVSKHPVRRFFVRLALSLILLALIVVALWLYAPGVYDRLPWLPTVSEEEPVSAEIAPLPDLRSEISDVRQELADLRRQIDELSADVRQSNAEIEAIGSKSLNDPVTVAATGTMDVIELKLLLRNAHVQLKWNGDTSSAMDFLLAARKVADEWIDPRRETVLRALSDDILSLQRVEGASRLDLFERIQLLIRELEELPVAVANRPLSKREQTLDGATPDGADESDATLWSRTKNLFSSMFEVHVYEDSESSTPMHTRWSAFAMERMVISLVRAQQGALDQDQSLYSNSLREARELLQQRFDEDSQQVDRMVESIRQLEESSVSRSVPDITRALILLQEPVPSDLESSVPTEEVP